MTDSFGCFFQESAFIFQLVPGFFLVGDAYLLYLEDRRVFV